MSDATPEEVAELQAILNRLREENPQFAERFSLNRQRKAVGMSDGESVLIMYSRAENVEGIIDCRYSDGSFPVMPLKDW